MFLLPLFLLFSYSCIILFVVSTSVNIVSIVDHTCIPSCLLKLFSILKSSSQPSAFEFYFLVMNDSIVTDLKNKLATCFPTTVFHIQLWSQNVPKTFPSLRMRGFEVPHIFARFYLPYIFPSVDRFIYLDNDMVTNADLIGLNSVLLFGNMFSGIIESNSMTRKVCLHRYWRTKYLTTLDTILFVL